MALKGDKKMRFRSNPFVLIGLLLVSICLAKTAAAAPRRIFILHSYEAGHACGQPQHDGLIEALEKAGYTEGRDFEIRAYFMDTKRHNNTPELIEAEARIARTQIDDYRPHVVVPLDDNAFRTVGLKLAGASVAVVFSGLNGQPEDYNRQQRFMDSRSRPGRNITGVYEKLHIADAIRVHTRLFSKMQRVRIYVDASPTGQAISRQIRIELAQEPIPCDWEMTEIADWEQYQQEILAVNGDETVGAIYPAVLMLKDRRQKTYTAGEIFAWTAAHSRKTEIPLNFAFARMGLFGGAAVDFHAMGVQAGKMVVSILGGTAPGEIAIADAEKYALVFNLKRAAQLGVEIPADVLMAADEVITP